MNLASTLIGAAAGMGAGVALWVWLRTGRYRLSEDAPRLSLAHTRIVIPAAAAAGALAGVLDDPWLVIAAWVYLVGSVVVVWIDLDVHRIPDRLLSWWAPALLASLVLATAMGGGGWGMLVTALLSGAALTVLFLVLALVGSMGLGDVKLAGVTGLMLGALGWAALTTGVAAGFAAGAVAALWMLVRGARASSHLAFGPAIIVGAAAAIARAGLAG
ncbi:A24 family peptidase [Nostocoides sp. F2B08]|uniref:prepilin peptidase n=1 Tax=Nostocoides sp. F2B08 TaxID=2653936 RepID=UPI001D03AECC|nr:A24 family peptidase [Tetrasphaera sp. F2B08]